MPIKRANRIWRTGNIASLSERVWVEWIVKVVVPNEDTGKESGIRYSFPRRNNFMLIHVVPTLGEDTFS